MNDTVIKRLGRPPLVIDEGLVKNLAMICCTYEEIASVCGCSIDTIRDRYSSLIREYREQGKMSLRRWQWNRAEKGSEKMLVWLGIQHLGQSNQREGFVPQVDLGPDGMKDVNTIDADVIEVKELLNARPKAV